MNRSDLDWSEHTRSMCVMLSRCGLSLASLWQLVFSADCAGGEAVNVVFVLVAAVLRAARNTKGTVAYDQMTT